MRCAGFPTPPDAKLYLLGSFLRTAINSETDFAGTDGCTTRTLYPVEILITGASSFSSRRPNFGSRAWAANMGMVIVRIAPGRFSTTTRQPSLVESSVAMMRPRTSGGEPGPVGATIRMVFDGYG